MKGTKQMDISKIIADVQAQLGTTAKAPAAAAAPAGKSAGYDPSYAKYMDHTVLKCETTQATVKRFCDEAKEYHFASVCINPTHVKFVHEQLKGSGVKTACVVGFPLGATTTLVKSVETAEAVKNGAEEIDMVINIGALKDKRYNVVFDDIKAVIDAAHPYAEVKVIIESSDLTDEEIVVACELSKRAGADWVKTSSGFGKGGATVEAVSLMKRTVGNACKVKASTGVNDRQIADALIAAGAERFGTSKGMIIVNGEASKKPAGCTNCGKCTGNCSAGHVKVISNEY